MCTNIKDWFTELPKLQSVISSISNLNTWTDGATKLLNPDVVTNFSKAINGLSLEQAKFVLSTKNLTQEQMNQILVEAGLIASENKVKASLLQTALAQSNVSKENQKAILNKLGLINAETGEINTTKKLTKEEILNALATKGITGANAEAILSALLNDAPFLAGYSTKINF